MLFMRVVDCMLSFRLISGVDLVFRPGVHEDYPASEWSFVLPDVFAMINLSLGRLDYGLGRKCTVGCEENIRYRGVSDFRNQIQLFVIRAGQGRTNITCLDSQLG